MLNESNFGTYKVRKWKIFVFLTIENWELGKQNSTSHSEFYFIELKHRESNFQNPFVQISQERTELWQTFFWGSCRDGVDAV